MLYVKCNTVGFSKILRIYLIEFKKFLPIEYQKLKNIDYNSIKTGVVAVRKIKGEDKESQLQLWPGTSKKVVKEHRGVVPIYSFLHPFIKIISILNRPHIGINIYNDESIKKLKNMVFESDFEDFPLENMWVIQSRFVKTLPPIEKFTKSVALKSHSLNPLSPELEEFKNNFIRENLSDIKDRYNDINKILQKEKGISLEFIDELNAYKHG